MFGKNNWILCRILPDQFDAMVNLLRAYGALPDGNRARVEDRLREEGGDDVFALSSFDHPTGDVEDTLSNCVIGPQVLGFWVSLITETPLADMKVLKESLSYTYYCTPFNLLDGEVKKDITEMAECDVKRGVKVTSAPVVMDFRRGYLWVSTTSKHVLNNLLGFLQTHDIDVACLHWSFPQDWSRLALAKIAEGDTYRELLEERATQVSAMGSPSLVPSHPDGKIERILKKYFRCLEFDGYQLFLTCGAKIHYTNDVTVLGVSSPHDAVGALAEGHAVSSARLRVQEEGAALFSIDLGFSHLDGHCMVKGLESHRLKNRINTAAKADGCMTVRMCWGEAHDENNMRLHQFINLLRDLLECPDGGLITASENLK